MIRQECDQCGESNPAGALFCASCNAYLAWDDTTSGDDIAPTTDGPPPGPAPVIAERLSTVLSPTEVQLAPGGEPVRVEITVQNLSVQDGGKAVVGHFTQHASLIAAQP